LAQVQHLNPFIYTTAYYFLFLIEYQNKRKTICYKYDINLEFVLFVNKQFKLMYEECIQFVPVLLICNISISNQSGTILQVSSVKYSSIGMITFNG